jgi:hypothetical protein
VSPHVRANAWRVARALGLAYAGWLALLFVMQRSMIYPGTARVAAASPPAAPGIEVWRLDTEDSPVEALFLPAPSPAAAARLPDVGY